MSNQRNKQLNRVQTSGVPAAYGGIMRSSLRRRRPPVPLTGRVLLANIAGSVGFAATKYNINPGLSEVFGTRASNIATGFDKHCMLRDLHVEYVASKAGTTTTGTIWLAADTNPNDAPPSNETDLSTYENWVSGRVFQNFDLTIPRTRLYDGVQHKLIRQGPICDNLITADAGSVLICTDDCADTTDIGKVYLVYAFGLISPQTAPSSIIPSGLVALNLSASQAYTTTTAAPVDFDEDLSSGFTLSNSSGVYTIPPGAYIITTNLGCTDSASEPFQGISELFVAGASTTPPQKSQFDLTSVAGTIPLNSTFFMSTSVSTTFQIQVTLTGAAGTLTVGGDKSRLYVRAV